MLHVIQSNKMEVLRDQLVTHLGSQSTGEASLQQLLQPETIIVQSPGMAQWLKIDIAEALGVAANLEFPLPSSFIWRQYQHYFDQLPATSAFTKPNMSWKLMTVLPQFLDHELFSDIANYLKDCEQLKQFLLCQKIADVFDQYQVYRPDWILNWETGSDLVDGQALTHHQWQPVLWRALVNQTRELNESTYHRANLHLSLLENIASKPKTAKKPLYIFGLSTLPKQQLEVFEALAQHQEVFLFWCNPCEQYWGDIVDEKTLNRLSLNKNTAETTITEYFEVGNPLLASWGKPGKDYLDMLLSSDVQMHELFVEQSSDTMLGWIQHEVSQLTMRDTTEKLSAQEVLTNGKQWPKLQIADHDDSVVIQSCHSKIRELEVLHDHLLHQFNRDPELRPSDVIVMMPDVAQYAPFINGVFGSVEESLSIPFAISDQNAAQESHLIDSFLQLMNLHQSRLHLSEILSLLEVPAIQARFDISEQDYRDIRFWLSDANFHWGWNGSDKARWLVPEDPNNTFEFVLHRMLAGYAMHDLKNWQPGEGAESQIAPYPEIEGQRAESLGKLMAFARCIDQLLQFCFQQAPLQQKVHDSLEFIEMLYVVEESEQFYLNQLRECLEEMLSHCTQFEQRISQDVFVAELSQRLNEQGVGQRFLTGAVNFCTLMPMRSIPFKHVCLLGMNDDDYPRQSVPIGFDLMRDATSRRGDRSRRLDDRYLFLEALLSARQKLYISYIGFSVRDNSVRNPSILLSELLTYLCRVFCLTGQHTLSESQASKNLLSHLLVEHGLQPFSSQYFLSTESASFQSQWIPVLSAQDSPCKAVEFFANSDSDRQLEPDSAVELSDLIAFFVNPARFHFSQRWRTNLNHYLEELNDDEPFYCDPFLRYQLTEVLLETSLSFEADEDQLHRYCLQQWRAQGLLPSGALGEAEINDLFSSTAQLRQKLNELVEGQPADVVEVNLLLESIELRGWLSAFYGHNYVLYRAGKLRAKDVLTVWLHWLCACAVKEQSGKHAFFLATDKTFTLAAIEQAKAKQILNDLVKLYTSANEQVPMFFPESGLVWVQSQNRNKTFTRFYGSDFANGEGQEPHIARACPDLDAVFEQFDAVSNQVFAPVLTYGSGL